MNLRDLIAAAAQVGHLDSPVYVWAYTADGEYVRHRVTDINVDSRTGEPRQILDIEPDPA